MMEWGHSRIVTVLLVEMAVFSKMIITKVLTAGPMHLSRPSVASTSRSCLSFLTTFGSGSWETNSDFRDRWVRLHKLVFQAKQVQLVTGDSSFT